VAECVQEPRQVDSQYTTPPSLALQKTGVFSVSMLASASCLKDETFKEYLHHELAAKMWQRLAMHVIDRRMYTFQFSKLLITEGGENSVLALQCAVLLYKWSDAEVDEWIIAPMRACWPWRACWNGDYISMPPESLCGEWRHFKCIKFLLDGETHECVVRMPEARAVEGPGSAE